MCIINISFVTAFGAVAALRPYSTTPTPAQHLSAVIDYQTGDAGRRFRSHWTDFSMTSDDKHCTGAQQMYLRSCQTSTVLGC